MYIGCLGHGNLGDEAVFEAIRKILKSKIYLYPISYAKPSSGKYFRDRILKAPDLIILGGGTIIKKKESESYLKLFLEYHEKYPNAKLIVFGAGVADPNLAAAVGFPTAVPQWKEVLNKCSFIGVRGEISKRILQKEWGVNPNINVLHDPALEFRVEYLKKKKRQRRIGLNFCNIKGRIYGLDQSAVELFARELVSRLIQLEWNIFLYPTAESDIGYMQKILGSELCSKINVYNNFKNLNSSLALLESLDVFVGQRLHSIVFSAISYTPFHAIEYESKTSDFLRSLGLPEALIRTDELDVEKVLNKIEALYMDVDSKQNELYQLVEKAHKEQLEISQSFLNQL